jgi:hypothetical protein
VAIIAVCIAVVSIDGIPREFAPVAFDIANRNHLHIVLTHKRRHYAAGSPTEADGAHHDAFASRGPVTCTQRRRSDNLRHRYQPARHRGPAQESPSADLFVSGSLHGYPFFTIKTSYFEAKRRPAAVKRPGALVPQSFGPQL